MVSYSDCDNFSKRFPISRNCLEIHDEDLYMIGTDICALHNITILNITGCKLAMILPELGLLSLTELNLGCNLLGLSTNWDWLKGKPLMNSLRELHLYENQLHFFPPQLVKYEKLVALNLRTNQITHLPFGMRRMRSLRIFDISRNVLVSLPSTYSRMLLQSMNFMCNNFMPRREHYLSCAVCQLPTSGRVDNFKPINEIPNDIAPLWLQAARVVSDKQLAFSNKTLPSNIVDLLLELPKCACGKLCDITKVYERAVRAKDLSYVYIDIVLCGKYCAGIIELIKKGRRHYHLQMK